MEQLLTLPWIKNALALEESSSPTEIDPAQAPVDSISILVRSFCFAFLFFFSSCLFSEQDKDRKKSDVSDIELRHHNEEHLTLKVHLADLGSDPAPTLSSVMLFVFQDTHAIAMVDVALKQAGVDADPNHYCLVEIDNLTLGLPFRPSLFFFSMEKG